ncbi:hypothetical protein lerEdw1_010546 [Lerista edwardsae]|nr:hypothetical protein lerEdw1_010546 [Lerista edwardsae]
MEGRVGRLEELGARIVALIRSAVALKEDLQIELAQELVKDQEDQGSSLEMSMMVSDGAAQPDQAPLAPPKQKETTTPSKALSAMHLDGNHKENMPMLDGILKNQEALQMVLRNQELLKSLVDRLLKTVSSIDERLRAIEQETGLLAQFTQELNEVGSEVSWG